jgi:hypothetical protein
MAISITAADSQNGGGLVITVAGSSGGSVSCYYQAADQTAWTLLGTRTGNGTISGTVTSGKTYFLYGLDGTTLSAVISSVVTAAADAVQERILAAVTSQLQAVATAGGFPGSGSIFPALTADNIIRQDVLEVEALTSNYPCIVVVPGSNESIGSDEMTQTDDVTYPVMCIILNTHDMTDQDYKKFYLKWREVISRKFRYQRVSGVTESRTTLIQYPQIFEAMQGQYAQFKSGIQLSAVCRETRGV